MDVVIRRHSAYNKFIIEIDGKTIVLYDISILELSEFVAMLINRL